MAVILGTIKLHGKVFVQFEGAELTEVGTIEVFAKPLLVPQVRSSHYADNRNITESFDDGSKIHLSRPIRDEPQA